MNAWRFVRTPAAVRSDDLKVGLGFDRAGADSLPADAAGPFLHLVIDTDDPVNLLSTPVMEELEERIGEIEKLAGVEALLLWSGKEKHFIAGADVKEIAAIQFPETGSAKAAQGQAIFGRLAALPFPTFAVIRGTCLGGGLELSLALDYRIAVDSPTTRIGLPEINLGIIPGFGGTQRLPRLVGLRSGLALVLAGNRLPARVAHRKGIVDVLVPPEGFEATALEVARRILADRGARVHAERSRRQGRWLPLMLEKNPLGRRLVAHMARKAVLQKTGGHYPAATAAVDAVIRGYPCSLKRGLQWEASRVGDLIASDVSKNLIAIFQDSERARRLQIDPDVKTPWPECAAVGVLGAGVMGAGIATLLLKRGHEVRLRDLEGEALRKGLARVAADLDREQTRRRITPREREAMLDRLTSTTGRLGFGRSDAVIEAVVERLEVKHAALREIESVLADTALIATNTSALSVTAIQGGLKHPERLVGLHFFNPVHRMPLVEVIPGAQTAPGALARAVSLAQSLGKYPVVVKDSPGFLVNRLLGPYLDVACRLLEQGIPGPRIDQAAVAFGLPMGPFRLLDEVGIDIAAEVSATLSEAFADRFERRSLLRRLVDAGTLGKKTGAGFYRYSDKTPAWNSDVMADGNATSSTTSQRIADTLTDAMIDEAARCLEEGVIERPSDVDLAMVMGTGFPPFRGGLLRYADRVRLSTILSRLRESRDSVPPCELLQKLATEGRGFYSLERASENERAPEKLAR